MGRKNKYRDAKAKREPGQFVSLPRIVLLSRGWTMLSHHAVTLMMDLLVQYNGFNNGDLCASWTVMEKRSWKSKDTLHKALQELKDGGWIIVSRQGGRNRATLYALTFYAIDDCNGKIDINATRSPTGEWRKNEPLPPLPKLMSSPRLAGQLSKECPN